MRKSLHIGDKLSLKVVTRITEQGQEYYIVKYGGESCKVRLFDFQKRIATPKELDCVCVGQDKYGKPRFNQEMTSVLYQLYEEECEYDFIVSGVSTDSKSHKRYLELTDEYGLKHRLYDLNYEALFSSHSQITCIVNNIKDGHLCLSCHHLQVSADTLQASQEELELFHKLHIDRLQDSKTLLKPQWISMWRSVIDKYPDSAHFIYELLQNADDAIASEVEIILCNDALVFKHNGKEHFTISEENDSQKHYGHINSITAVGRSPKSDNKIGKFGVGFKSVFTYTDTPEIYDDKFRFKIENYMIPTLLSKDHYLRKAGETMFYIPFKDPEKAYKEIKRKLETLDNPILFLRNLRKISWFEFSRPTNIYIYTKNIPESFVKNGIEVEYVSLKNVDDRRNIWLFSKSVTISEAGKHTISVGYYINQEGEIDTKIRPNVYCFFPTKESYDICLITHAPFELVDSRQNVKENSDVNILLSKELAHLAAESLPILRDIGLRTESYLINDNLLEIVPIEDELSYRYNYNPVITNSHFFKSYVEAIKKDNFFLTRDNQYVGVDDSILANPINLAEVLTDGQIKLLLEAEKHKYFVFPTITTRDDEWIYLSSVLGIPVFTSEKLAEAINKQPSFMSQQDDQWLHKLYSFLKQDAISLWKPGLYNKKSPMPFRYCPILRLRTGKFAPAYIRDALNVFYSSIDADGTVNIIDPVLLDNKTSKSFFDELGLKEIDKADYVKKILIKYESEQEIDDDEIISDFMYIYEYSLQCTYSERERFIETISNRLSVVYICDGNSFCGKIDTVYGDKYLDTYFRGYESLNLIDMDFYAPIIEKHGKREVMSFLYEVGLKDLPLPREIKEEGYSPDVVFRMNLSQEQRYAVYHPNKRPVKVDVYDYMLDGLSNAINNNLTKGLSKVLWERLRIDLYQFRYLKCKYIYYTPSDCTFRADSTFYKILMESAWLFDASGNRFTPNEISWRELEKAGYAYNNSLLDFLDIKRGGIDDLEGVTDEQKKIFAKGEKVKDLTDEELDEMLREREKRRIKSKDKARNSQNNADIFQRYELEENNASEMFVGNEAEDRKPQKEKKTVDKNKRVEEIEQNLEIEKEKILKREQLKNEVDSAERYSFGWFMKLLQLEYNYSYEEENTTSNKAIHISFSSVSKEVGSERIYVLKNPSRLIPIGIEDVGGLEVHFMFSDQDDKVFSFEVASVRDYTLRVKAAKQYADALNSISWNRCTCAYVNINNPVELMSKLINAFAKLGFGEDYNLKTNLGDNFSFVFGPPGTGKTTYLANRIVHIMNEEAHPRVLVLAPTNKACDVITKKITEITDDYDWLGRFMATSDESIENSGLVIDASSDLYKDKCCVVSTIARLPYDGFNDFNHLGGLRDIEWDYVIVDEASMIPLVQIVYALYKFENSQIIIAGDPLQIAPIVREERWKDENIYTMVNLLRFDNPITEPRQFDITNLTTQYRSLPSIGQVFSEYAYDGKLCHHRKEDSKLPLNIDGIDLKPVNFITFRVEKTDGVFAPKKLSGSNVHVYSVLLVVEYAKYFAEQYIKNYEDGRQLRIGIICPYAAQAQLIDTLLLQSSIDQDKVLISVGTIHGFQGDECDVIFTVFNPPVGLKGAPDKVFLNNKNIINVAISRARDYLFVFMPHKSTEGFDNLRELIRLGRIAIKYPESTSMKYTSDSLENVIFGRKFYIENNTFVTTHQMANVYTAPEKLYEVRIDESAVDVQINTELAE